MIIRRNMNSNVSYQQLKEHPCFKQLASKIDVLVLKEILPMVVKKVTLDVAMQSLNQNKMMYIPEQNNEGIQTVKAMGATIKNLKQNVNFRFLMIQTKIYNILKYLFHKKIACIDQIKHFQKLNFFYRCDLDEVPFGGYIYRKDDTIKNIYYLVRGQINISKCVDQKQIIFCNIYEGTFFGIFQFQKNKIKRLLNAQSCSNDTIILTISLDMVAQIFGKDDDQVLEKLLSMPSQIQKISSQQNKKHKTRQVKLKNNNFIKAYEFKRRLIKFQETRGIDKNDSVFGRFVENKSLLFKIKDSNDKNSKTTKKQNVVVKANFHKSQSMAKYHDRLNQHRLYTLGIKQQTSKKQIKNILRNSSMRKGSQLLSSGLKQKFKSSRKYFQNTDRQTTNKKSYDC